MTDSPSSTTTSHNYASYVLCGICLLSITVLITTLLDIPLYDSFYPYHPKPWGAPLEVAVLAIAFMVLTPIVVAKSISPRLFLFLAIMAGTTLQWGFAMTEGRGVDGLRDRVVTSGHAEFVRKAVKNTDIPFTMSHYESLAESGKLGVFSKAKPPGQILFYMITERFSEWVLGKPDDNRERVHKLQDFITLVWPFFAALAALPLYALTVRLSDAAAARMAVGLYFLTPSFNRVTLHTDQVLFPLLVLVCLYGFIISRWRRAGIYGAMPVQEFCNGYRRLWRSIFSRCRWRSCLFYSRLWQWRIFTRIKRALSSR